jgi:hypothetical protein
VRLAHGDRRAAGVEAAHRRQVVTGQQLSEHARVDLVGLDLRLGDHSNLARMREDDPCDMRFEDPRDRQCVARRLQRNLILWPQALHERVQRLRICGDPPCPTRAAALMDRDLTKVVMHSHPNRPQLKPSFDLDDTSERPAGKNDSYGFALTAQPGKSQGRPITPTS